jgi:hypothetical protein
MSPANAKAVRLDPLTVEKDRAYLDARRKSKYTIVHVQTENFPHPSSWRKEFRTVMMSN